MNEKMAQNGSVPENETILRNLMPPPEDRPRKRQGEPSSQELIQMTAN